MGPVHGCCELPLHLTLPPFTAHHSPATHVPPPPCRAPPCCYLLASLASLLELCLEFGHCRVCCWVSLGRWGRAGLGIRQGVDPLIHWGDDSSARRGGDGSAPRTQDLQVDLGRPFSAPGHRVPNEGSAPDPALSPKASAAPALAFPPALCTSMLPYAAQPPRAPSPTAPASAVSQPPCTRLVQPSGRLALARPSLADRCSQPSTAARPCSCTQMRLPEPLACQFWNSVLRCCCKAASSASMAWTRQYFTESVTLQHQQGCAHSCERCLGGGN